MPSSVEFEDDNMDSTTRARVGVACMEEYGPELNEEDMWKTLSEPPIWNHPLTKFACVMNPRRGSLIFILFYFILLCFFCFVCHLLVCIVLYYIIFFFCFVCHLLVSLLLCLLFFFFLFSFVCYSNLVLPQALETRLPNIDSGFLKSKCPAPLLGEPRLTCRHCKTDFIALLNPSGFCVGKDPHEAW